MNVEQFPHSWSDRDEVTPKNVENTINRADEKQILRSIGTTKKLLSKIRKRQLKLFGHMMRKEGLENSTLTGHIEGKRSSGKTMSNLLNMFEETDNSTKMSRIKSG